MGDPAMRTAQSPTGTQRPHRRFQTRFPTVMAEQARHAVGMVVWVAIMLCAIGVVVSWRQQHGDRMRRLGHDRFRASLLGPRGGWPMYGAGTFPSGPFSLWFRRMGWSQME